MLIDINDCHEWATAKEIVERRHGEPIKFLFLPKMGLLGSQASTEKKIGYELWATFEGCFFMSKNLIFLNLRSIFFD